MRVLQILTLIGITISATNLAAQVGLNNDVINPNTAASETLNALPGLNADLVEKIESARPLASNLQLDSILGDALTGEQKEILSIQLFLPVNLNSASREEIMLIPAISEKMAHEFEEYRPYTSIQQFRREIGKYVDENEVARFEKYVFVPMNLNSASSEELASIPGMSKRMVHEFEEYRPYTSIEQFRREIGKYVDEREVARLERYIYID